MHENSNKDRDRQIQKVKQGYFRFTFFPKSSYIFQVLSMCQALILGIRNISMNKKDKV